ncbi:hypothetical protein ZONE111905_20325 [Zobellia nedashkovskayae]
MLLLIYSSTILSQARKSEQSNTDYLIELMKDKEIEHIYIVGVNKYFQYNKEWLDDIIIDGDFITFKNIKEDKIHSWDISNTTFIERYRDVIKIRLSVSVGE